MPTPLGDTLPSITPHSASDNPRRSHLPVHHDPQFPYAQELDDLSTSTVQRHRKHTSTNSRSNDATEAEDSKHLLGDQDSADEDEEDLESDSMGTRSRK